MNPIRVGPYRLRYDADATRAAHARRPAGGPEECACLHCRNWVAARTAAYSGAFLALLETFGLPPDRESEVAHYDQIEPGSHVYGGWFHFVGLIDGRDDDTLAAVAAPEELCSLHTDLRVVPDSLKGHPLVQLEFSRIVPWLLNEPFAG